MSRFVHGDDERVTPRNCLEGATDRRLFAAGKKPAGESDVRITVGRAALLDLIQDYGTACFRHGWESGTVGDARDATRASRMQLWCGILDVLDTLRPDESGPTSGDGSHPVAPPAGPRPGDDSATEPNLRSDGPEVESEIERARRLSP